MKYTIETFRVKLSVQEHAEKVRGPEDVLRISRAIYETLDAGQEHFTVLFLDSQNKVCGFKTMFSGGVSGATVDMKVLFRNVLLSGASNIMLIHNHPGGVTTPSQADKDLTKAVQNAATLLAIRVLDHLIISHGDEYYSFAQAGEI